MEKISKPREIGKIKLNELSKAELESRQMNALKGGSGCACFGCGCVGGIAASDSNDPKKDMTDDGKDW